MGLFLNLFKKEMNKMTDKQLEDEYEKRRLKWLKSRYRRRHGDITKKMEMLNDEMSRRTGERVDAYLKKHHKKPINWTDKNRWEKD